MSSFKNHKGVFIPVALLAVLVAGAFFVFGLRGTAPAEAARLTVNLDQCANDPRTADCTWQNGNLYGNNSIYAEHLVVPFRLTIKGLQTNGGHVPETHHHTININYDFTSGGHKGYDFLHSFDETEMVDECATGGGAVSSLCAGGLGGDTTDTEPFVEGAATADGLLVSAAVTDHGGAGVLRIYGGNIVSIDYDPDQPGGNLDGNSTRTLVVTFTHDDGPDVLFLWGGHLASSDFWNISPSTDIGDDGANEISGAPWHMRTQQLDAHSNKNQDRSIQPSALAPTISIHKEDDSGNHITTDTATFTMYDDIEPLGGAEPDAGGLATITGLSCTTDGTGHCDIVGIPAGRYWVVETDTPDGYDTADPQNVTLANGDDVTLTFVDPELYVAIVIVCSEVPGKGLVVSDVRFDSDDDNDQEDETATDTMSSGNLLTDVGAASGTSLAGVFAVSDTVASAALEVFICRDLRSGVGTAPLRRASHRYLLSRRQNPRISGLP